MPGGGLTVLTWESLLEEVSVVWFLGWNKAQGAWAADAVLSSTIQTREARLASILLGLGSLLVNSPCPRLPSAARQCSSSSPRAAAA
ncbi:hypothetical protein XELAEV_18034730mg [Xenopus laevis]|uniref:Uncharacterized protein n=1 Tax=Xenopus laevis TaxID=8355 RepID=A0A974CEI0_XENLA|nr:hypothetical protein XELAEV_18034730mg [Xenopus laevis]